MTPVRTLVEALLAPNAVTHLRSLDAAGALTQLIPELEEGRGFAQPELHYYSVLDHNLAAVAAFDAATGHGDDGQELRAVLHWIDLDELLQREIEGLPILALTRLAALLHDVAKPETAAFVEGRLRFPRHGPRGAEMMRERLPRLGFGPAATDFVARVIRQHLRPRELVRDWPPSERAMHRFVADLDGHVLPLMLVNLADGMATRGPGYTRENFRRHCQLVNYVVARSVGATAEEEPPLVTGEDLLRELHLKSGRLLGAVLTSVRRAQEAVTVSNREEALMLARAIVAGLTQQGEGPGP
jgi:putative nucleotidyltransferase with HDIG domain